MFQEYQPGCKIVEVVFMMQKYRPGLVKTIPSCKRCACVRWFTLSLPLLLLLLGFLNASLDVLHDVHQLLLALKTNTTLLANTTTCHYQLLLALKTNTTPSANTTTCHYQQRYSHDCPSGALAVSFVHHRETIPSPCTPLEQMEDRPTPNRWPLSRYVTTSSTVYEP